MPILTAGRYVIITSPGDGFVRGQAANFTYIPWHLTFWAGGLILLGLIARTLRRARVSYSVGRYLVLAPLLIGILLMVLFRWNFPVAAAAVGFETVTAAFLFWRIFRARNRVFAAVLTFAAGAFVFGAYYAIEFWSIGLSDLAEFIPAALLFGGMAAAPIAGVRILAGRVMTWKRILLGLITGLVFVLGLFGIAVLQFGSPDSMEWLLFLFMFAVPGVLFPLTAKWNAWARDVATGEMFRTRKPKPGTELPG